MQLIYHGYTFPYTQRQVAPQITDPVETNPTQVTLIYRGQTFHKQPNIVPYRSTRSMNWR